MWILRYLILSTRQRSNALLDRRTRMTFDPLHGCPMHVCRDKAEWDRRGKEQVAHLESELRQDIEAYHTVTGERRVIAGETIEVRPVVLEKDPEPLQAFNEFLGATDSAQGSGVQEEAPEPEVEETILPEAAPETEAVTVPTGDALVSSGVEAQAEAEPGAVPTLLEDAELNGLPQNAARTGEKKDGTGSGQDLQNSKIPGLGTDSEPAKTGTALPSTEVPEPVTPTEAPTPKTKTKPAGKAGKK